MILYTTMVALHLTFLVYWYVRMVHVKKDYGFYIGMIVFNIAFVLFNHTMAKISYEKKFSEKFQEHLDQYHSTPNPHQE